MGRGNDLCCQTIALVSRPLIGRDVDGLLTDPGGTWNLLTGDSELRWLDACRLGGVNEVLAVLLLVVKFRCARLPACRRVEYGPLHEHFVDPVRVRGGSYLPPILPGYSVELKPESVREHRYPDGPGLAIQAGMTRR